jgi:hypothetical protein
MTNRQIGEALFVAEQTVKNNVTSLLAKLGMQRRTQAAVLAAGLRGHPPTTVLRYQRTDDQGLTDVAATGASRHD